MLLWSFCLTPPLLFPPLSAPPVLPVRDLPGLGGRAGPELQPPWCRTYLLPGWAGQAGGHRERPGILLRPGLEREDSCPWSHQKILPQTQTSMFCWIIFVLHSHFTAVRYWSKTLHPFFFRLAKKAQNFCWPTLTPGTWVTCLEGRSWAESPRSPWGWRAARVCRSSPSLVWPAQTCSNSCTAAAWTAWSWQRRRGMACWRRLSERSSSTFRYRARETAKQKLRVEGLF